MIFPTLIKKKVFAKKNDFDYTLLYIYRMFFLLMEFLFSKIVKFYKNLKYGSSGLSGLYVEARQHFLGYRDMLIWHVITVIDIHSHRSTQ